MRLLRLMFLIAFMLILLASPGTGQYLARVPLPADLQGELNGVPYRIRVPENWNGTLLVYSYGYAEAYMPLRLAPTIADSATLLSRGFALAGVKAAGAVPLPGAETVAGFNMKERIQDTAALTATFRELVGRPKYTIVWGKSMGGLVSLALVEKFPGLYDGAVPLCAPAAGTPHMFDQKLDIVLAYSVAFGWKDEWGTPDNLRADLNVVTEVAPHVRAQMTPAKMWRWEFFRRVNRIPEDASFYAMPTPFLFQTIWLAFAPQADMNQRAGGHVGENIGRVYTLSDEDKAYLIAMGGDPESLLAAMNAKTIYASDPNARNYAQHYYNPTGRITRPVITLHTTGDAAAIPNNENFYHARVEEQGKSELLIQQFSVGNGLANTHCTFAPAQYFAGIDAMVYWVETGNRPDPAVFFPESIGFDQDYAPGKWPW